MACGNIISTQVEGMLQKGLELDLPVAQYVWIRRTPGSIFLQKIGENPVPVFARKIDRMQSDAQLIRDRLGISKVLSCSTVVFLIIFFPVFHEQRFH